LIPAGVSGNSFHDLDRDSQSAAKNRSGLLSFVGGIEKGEQATAAAAHADDAPYGLGRADVQIGQRGAEGEGGRLQVICEVR
jgi:hypothetical protein